MSKLMPRTRAKSSFNSPLRSSNTSYHWQNNGNGWPSILLWDLRCMHMWAIVWWKTSPSILLWDLRLRRRIALRRFPTACLQFSFEIFPWWGDCQTEMVNDPSILLWDLLENSSGVYGAWFPFLQFSFEIFAGSVITMLRGLWSQFLQFSFEIFLRGLVPQG